MPTPLWSHQLSGPAVGMAVARESGHALIWDVNHRLTILSRRGSVQAHLTHSRPIIAAAISDDGSAVFVADYKSGTWLRRDLSPRWRKDLQSKPTAVSLDPFGHSVAVADAGNHLQLFNMGGKSIAEPIVAPRPLFHLTFLPTEPILSAAADFGLVITLDLRLRQWVWQDAPVIHLGDLSPSISPATLAVASFSEGVRRYDSMGKALASVPTSEACRHVAVSADARRLLIGTIFGGLCGYSDAGSQLFEQRFDQSFAGVRLAPLADMGWVALVDGRIMGLDLSEELK
jgi:hypothetical protein